MVFSRTSPPEPQSCYRDFCLEGEAPLYVNHQTFHRHNLGRFDQLRFGMTKLSPSPRRLRPSICVFCGSSHGADPVYTEAARQFGTRMVEAGFDLVFGGGGVGLMGEVALL